MSYVSQPNYIEETNKGSVLSISNFAQFVNLSAWCIWPSSRHHQYFLAIGQFISFGTVDRLQIEIPLLNSIL